MARPIQNEERSVWFAIHFLLLLPACLATVPTEIRIGALFVNHTPDYFVGYCRSAAVLSMAEKDMKREGILPQSVFFNYSVPNLFNRTHPLFTGEAVELYMEGVDLMVGPFFSGFLQPIGFLTSHWNLPHMTWGAVDSSLRDKAVFRTLIRTLTDVSAFGTVLKLLRKKFGWKKLALLTSDLDDYVRVCSYYKNAVERLTQSGLTDITVGESNSWEEATNKTDEAIDMMLEQVRQRARIVILCASADMERRIMIRAHRKQMTTGEYVWLMPHCDPETGRTKPWWRDEDEYNWEARQAYRVVFEITWAQNPDTQAAKVFREQIAEEMTKPPWNNRFAKDNGFTGDRFTPYLYDLMFLYGRLLNDSFTHDWDYRDGALMFEKAKKVKEFQGMSGRFSLDGQGDRIPDWWMYDYHVSNGSRYVAYVVDLVKNKIISKTDDEPDWNNVPNKPPTDTPDCGYMNEYCDDSGARNSLIIGLMVSSFAVISALGAGGYIYRQKKLEEELTRMLWKVDYCEILPKRANSIIAGSRSLASSTNVRAEQSGTGLLTPVDDAASLKSEEPTFIQIGVWRGVQVAVKRLRKDSLLLKRPDLLELKEMRDVANENINQFVGMCTDAPNICVLFVYCAKGSLADILANETIKLDNAFKISMVQDIVNGIVYIHDSWFRCHGRLKSSNCVVDSRWLLKITDFGLPHVLASSDESLEEYARASKLWWTAPEVLRNPDVCPRGTQKGDIYSFAIIVYEIAFRKSPYETDLLTPKEIVDRVRRKELPLYRPQMYEEPFNGQIKTLMTDCWRESPDERPDAVNVRKMMKAITKGKKLNLMDHMVNMMERYANHLEEVVESRTNELMNEKKKTDMLLHRMLPASVADRLKRGEIVHPESYEEVTIYFSDVVGFTTISSASTPFQVVDLLNDLYTMFDASITKFDVYKVETIGDAYMCVSGLPKRNGNRHSMEIADMALDLLDAVLHFKIRHIPEILLMIRVGLHTGPCCAGVVGLAMPRYCLFGDTVNMASRMESNGAGLRIHCSEACYSALSKFGVYHMELRGCMEIKGKGTQRTYWLVGKQGHSKRLPTQVELNPMKREDGLPIRGKSMY